jgi:hypothetical protein
MPFTGVLAPLFVGVKQGEARPRRWPEVGVFRWERGVRLIASATRSRIAPDDFFGVRKPKEPKTSRPRASVSSPSWAGPDLAITCTTDDLLDIPAAAALYMISKCACQFVW